VLDEAIIYKSCFGDNKTESTQNWNASVIQNDDDVLKSASAIDMKIKASTLVSPNKKGQGNMDVHTGNLLNIDTSDGFKVDQVKMLLAQVKALEAKHQVTGKLTNSAVKQVRAIETKMESMLVTYDRHISMNEVTFDKFQEHLKEIVNKSWAKIDQSQKNSFQNLWDNNKQQMFSDFACTYLIQDLKKNISMCVQNEKEKAASLVIDSTQNKETDALNVQVTAIEATNTS
jgi:hypothetical protein